MGRNIGSITAVIFKPKPQMQTILIYQENRVVSANQVSEVGGVVDRYQIVG